MAKSVGFLLGFIVQTIVGVWQVIKEKDMRKKKKQKKPINKYKRAKHIERIMVQAIDSLTSHLPYTHRHTQEGQKFHKDCITEYLEILNNANELW